MPNELDNLITHSFSGSNTVLDLFPKSFWQNRQFDINRSKGKGYERLAKSLIFSSLKNKIDMSKITILLDKKWFYCFDEKNFKRRYDIFLDELLVGYEIKSSRIVYNSFIRKQIQKDNWLLLHEKVNEVRWLLFNGATKNVLQALNENKILYLDVTNDDENTFTNIRQIYQEVHDNVFSSTDKLVIPI